MNKNKRTTYVIYGVPEGKVKKKVLGTNYNYRGAKRIALGAVETGRYSKVKIYRTELLKNFTPVRKETHTREEVKDESK